MAVQSRATRPIGRGDIVLVPFPFTDLSQAKRRPGVVIWADAAGTDYVIAFISSRVVIPGAGDVVLLPTHPEFGLTGLSVPSKIRTTKLVTLARELLRRWIGRLGTLLIADLDRALVTALGINTVPYREEGRRNERARLQALHGAGGPAALRADLDLT